MTIDTINNALLPVVLFLIYVCTASVFFYSPTAVSSSKPKAESISNFAKSVSDAFDEIFEPDKPVSFVQKVSSSQGQPFDLLMTQATHVINTLTKREARKLCKPLCVKQTHTLNGTKTELTLSLMKGAFLNKLKSNPDEVFSTIQNYLPEKMSDKEALKQVS